MIEPTCYISRNSLEAIRVSEGGKEIVCISALPSGDMSVPLYGQSVEVVIDALCTQIRELESELADVADCVDVLRKLTVSKSLDSVVTVLGHAIYILSNGSNVEVKS